MQGLHGMYKSEFLSKNFKFLFPNSAIDEISYVETQEII